MLRKRGLATTSSVSKYINRFPTLEYTGTLIRCVVCNITISVYDSFSCKKHVQTKRHIANAAQNIPYWKFVHDFICMLSVCNIPQHVVDNENFCEFWKKYVPAWTLPTRRQLQYNLPRVKETVEKFIQSEVRNNEIWLTVDETTDAKKNSVVNVLVRTLKNNEPSFPLLLSSKRLQNTNPESIVQTITDATEKFGITRIQVVMLVTDGSPNMMTASEMLKKYFPNILHVTCLLHAFHLLSEYIRKSYPKIDNLIIHTRKIFVKSPERIREFKKSCPCIPLPPQPILTRCGTWLEAVLYYEKYIQNIRPCILKFILQESQAIQLSQQLLSSIEIETEIKQISVNYSVVIEAISKLQNSKLSLAESLKVVHHLKYSLERLTDTVGIRTAKKFSAILNKNPDFQKIVYIEQCLSENQDDENDGIDYFKFANVTSLDVERSFSKYSHTFSPYRRCLSESSMEGLLMIPHYVRFSHWSASTPE